LRGFGGRPRKAMEDDAFRAQYDRCFRSSLLSTTVADVLRDGDHTIHVSGVSFWEISIKHALGKLILEGISPAELPGSILSGLQCGWRWSCERLGR